MNKLQSPGHGDKLPKEGKMKPPKTYKEDKNYRPSGLPEKEKKEIEKYLKDKSANWEKRFGKRGEK